MAYVKQTWENLPSETTPISAERLAHMETQYDEALAEVTPDIATLQGQVDLSVKKGDLVLNVKDFGAVGDGLTSDSAAIQAAMEAAVDGSTILFPGGTYRITESIRNLRKSVSVEASGSVFVKDGSFTSVNFYGGFSDPVNVSNLVINTIEEPDRTKAGLLLTLESPVTWKQGDIVKVISDDVIPGTKDEGNGDPRQARMGQFFSVYSVSGTSVQLIGRMLDPFTTNIRIGKIDDISASWNGGLFDVTDSEAVAPVGSRTINFENMPNCRVTNVSVRRSTSMAFAVVGCYNPLIENVSVRWARNDLENSGLGYAVANFSSQGLSLRNLYAQSVRSGYTDGHGFAPVGTTSWGNLGRPNNTIISDSVAESCGTGFGCHSSGTNTLINNCIVRDCGYGIGFRGRNNVATNITVENASDAAVRIFTENSSQTYGMTIDGLKVTGCYHAVEFWLNANTVSPHLGEREVRPSLVRNVHATRVTGHGIRLENATAILENIYVEYRKDIAASGNYFINSIAYGSDWRFDVNLISVNGGLALFQFLGDPGRFQVDRVVVRGNMGRLQKLIHGNVNHVIRASNVLMDTSPSSVIHDALNPESWVQYEIASPNSDSSAYRVFTATQAASASNLAVLGNRRDPNIVAKVTGASGSTLAALPLPGSRGQLLVIQNDGTGTLTIPNGVAFNTSLSGGADVVLPAGSSIMLLGFTGLWQQLKFA